MLPVYGFSLRVTDKLPVLEPCFGGKLNDEILVLSDDVLDCLQGDFYLSFGDVIVMMEGQCGCFGNASSVPDVLIVEDKQSLIGEEQSLSFLFEQRVSVDLLTDLLLVEFLLDLFLELLADNHPPLVRILLLHQ